VNAESATFSWNQANQFTLPIEKLRVADTNTAIAFGLAVADFKPDNDGVYRRGRMLFRYDDGGRPVYFPSLSLKAAMALAGDGPVKIEGRTLRIGGLSIPVDERGNCLVNYTPGKIDTYSMSALLESAYYLEQGEADKMRLNPEVFKDKVVIIGVSAVGGQDLKNTPVSGTLPGPQIHANLISDILQDNHITREPLWLSWLLILLVTGLAIGAVFYVKSSVGQILAQAAILLGYVLLAILAFRFANYLSAMFVVAVAGLVGSGVSYIYKSMTEGAEKRKYSKILGNMVDTRRRDGNHGLLLGRGQFFHDQRKADQRRAGRPAQRIPVSHDIDIEETRGHARQIYRRCGGRHLRRPGPGRRYRVGRCPGLAGDA
jgi:hypothetical protein